MAKDPSFRFATRAKLRDPYHPNQTALTPDYILEPVRRALGGIGLDPCTTPDNPCDAWKFYAPPDDGLVLPWEADTIYVNPPYGNARIPWLQRCIDESADGRQVVLLMPSASDTEPFQRMLRTAHSLCFIKGRVKFKLPRLNGRQMAASHPSILAGFNVDLSYECAALGYCLALSPEARNLRLVL